MLEQYEATPPSTLSERLLQHELSVEVYDCRRVDLLFREPMMLPFGEVVSRPSAWTTLACRFGGAIFTGQGEGATLNEPLFTDDSGHNVQQNTMELAQSLVNLGSRNVGDLAEAIGGYSFSDGGHYPTARLSIESAILDAFARSQKSSIKDMLGIPTDLTEVAYGKSIGANTQEEILDQAREAFARSASKIKLKVSPNTFHEVIHAIQQIKSEFSTTELMVDANGTFDPNLDQHLEMIDTLDRSGLILIEEPVSRQGSTKGIEAVELLRSRLPNLQTMVCLDDCLKTYADCVRVIKTGLADAVNIKPGRIGSFISSLKIADLAKERGALVMVGGMFEATPGRCMTTILAAYCIERGCSVPGDISLAQERLAGDLVGEEKMLQLGKTGNIVIPTGIGWGF